MSCFAALLERQQTEITQHVSKVGLTPFDSRRCRMMTYFGVRLRQMVIRNRGPEVMGRMIVHIQRSDKQPFQRITEKRNQPMFVGPRLRPRLRMFAESAKVISRES